MSPDNWKDGAWTALPPLDTGKDAEVYAFVETVDALFAAGYCKNTAGVPVPGYWRNGTWTSLAPLCATREAKAYSLAITGNAIYAAGYGKESTGKDIAGYWKNGSWVHLPELDPSPQAGSQAARILVSGDYVYAAGYSCDSTSSHIAVPGYWLNGSWRGLPAPDPAQDAYVDAMPGRARPCPASWCPAAGSMREATARTARM
jgi:hypothetical protein